MSTKARIHDSKALLDTKAALVQFVEQVTAAVAGMDADVARLSMWLHQDRPMHWKHEIRRREDLVLNAKTDKTADIKPSLATHGLETPGVKISIKAGTLSETVALGDVLIGGDRSVVYVTTTDRPGKAQAIRRNDLQTLFKGDVSKGGPASQ
ncbi:MAG: hypothetical protein NTV94_10480, partial [Planctomycetota bacterium]|nr:hypothetical protein [Planctomycetota bacterium]